MNKASRRNNTSFFVFLSAAALILGLCAGLLLALNSQVTHDFGPPNGKLTMLQKVSLRARLFVARGKLLEPAAQSSKTITFEVGLGEPIRQITDSLEKAGLVQDSGVFQSYLVYSGMDSAIQAGKYEFSPSSSAIVIARNLIDSAPSQVAFSILPGWRAEEIASQLPTSGLVLSPEEFLHEVAQPAKDNIPPNVPPNHGLEGFLAPGLYYFDRTSSMQKVIQAFVLEFYRNVDPALVEGFQKNGLDLYQGVILASMVEKEAILQEEKPVIASVFLNRLEAGMNLDSDPTVQYAIGYDSKRNIWWKNPLSSEDLDLESPFNTYLHAGLPPAPISNPSLAALKAVAFPSKTTYYYFRARCDASGRHNFAETLEEQINNECP